MPADMKAFQPGLLAGVRQTKEDKAARVMELKVPDAARGEGWIVVNQRRAPIMNSPDNAFTLRDATPEDAAALLALYAPYVQDSAISFETEVPTVAAFAERIARTARPGAG